MVWKRPLWAEPSICVTIGQRHVYPLSRGRLVPLQVRRARNGQRYVFANRGSSEVTVDLPEAISNRYIRHCAVAGTANVLWFEACTRRQR